MSFRKVINALRAGEMAEREHALHEVLGIDLQGRNLRDAELSKSILPKADLRRVQLQGADLRRAQLQDADLREARIGGAGFEDANLDFTESTRSRSQAAD
jgi:uncharacterized protein YjbI with pentapeptide repeats